MTSHRPLAFLRTISDFTVSTSHTNNTFVSGSLRVTNGLKSQINVSNMDLVRKGTQSCCWGSTSTSAAFWLRSSLLSGSADPSLSFLGERDAERDLDLDF